MNSLNRNFEQRVPDWYDAAEPRPALNHLGVSARPRLLPRQAEHRWNERSQPFDISAGQALQASTQRPDDEFERQVGKPSLPSTATFLDSIEDYQESHGRDVAASFAQSSPQIKRYACSKKSPHGLRFLSPSTTGGHSLVGILLQAHVPRPWLGSYTLLQVITVLGWLFAGFAVYLLVHHEGRRPTAHLAASKQSDGAVGEHHETMNNPSGGLIYEPSELIPPAPPDNPAEDSPATKPPNNRQLESPQSPEPILEPKLVVVGRPKKLFVPPDLPAPPRDPIVLLPPPDTPTVVAASPAMPALAVLPTLNGTELSKASKPSNGFKRAIRALFGTSGNTKKRPNSPTQNHGKTE
jgi:hypothetical protein